MRRRRISGPRSAVLRRARWWAVGSALGVAVLALPDTGPPVVSLSETHGPAAVDLIGIAILVVAWAPIATLIWTARRSLARRRLLGAGAAAGTAVLVVTIAWDRGVAWIAGVAILVAVQVVAVRDLARDG